MAARPKKKKENKPRLAFTPEEDNENGTEEETLRYTSLMDAECHWAEHEELSSSHEAVHKAAKDRPSVTATAGKGVFAKHYNSSRGNSYGSRDCGNFTFKVRIVIVFLTLCL